MFAWCLFIVFICLYIYLFMKKGLIKFLLLIGIHNWEYSGDPDVPGTIRTCKWNGTKQILTSNIPVSGWANDAEWEAVK